MFQLSPERMVN